MSFTYVAAFMASFVFLLMLIGLYTWMTATKAKWRWVGIGLLILPFVFLNTAWHQIPYVRRGIKETRRQDMLHAQQLYGTAKEDRWVDVINATKLYQDYDVREK